MSARAALITHEMFIHAPNANEILERELRQFAAEILREATNLAGSHQCELGNGWILVPEDLERRAVAYREGK